jgi:hypothetical protein
MRLILIALLSWGVAVGQTASFPGSVVTDSELMVAVNLIKTTLISPVAPTDTIINVQSTAGMVPNELMSLDTEIVVICSIPTNTTFQVGFGSCPSTSGRGFDGTTATSHTPATGDVNGNVDAWNINALRVEVKAVESGLGANFSNVLHGYTTSGTGTQLCLTVGCSLTNANLNTPSAINLANASNPPTWNQNTTGNAATATSLANTPTICNSGQAPRGTLANGNATGCQSVSGGGSSTASQLLDFQVTRSSGTVLAGGASCSTANPCNVRVGPTTTYSFTAGFSPTLSGASATGTARFYVDSSGNLTCASDTLTISSCGAGTTIVTGVTAFPYGSIPLWTWTSLSVAGVWDSAGGTDNRAFQSTQNLVAGSGIDLTNTASSTTIAVDPSVLTPSIFNSTLMSASEEFLPNISVTGQVGAYGWDFGSVAGGCSGGVNVAGVANHPGLFRLTSTTGYSSGSGIGCFLALSDLTSGGSNPFANLNSGAWTNWQAQSIMETASVSTAHEVYVVGFTDTFTSYHGGSANEIAVRYDPNGVTCSSGTDSTTHFVYEVMSTGSITCLDSGVAPAASTWYHFNIYSNASGVVNFQINGANTGTISSGIPSANLAPVFMGLATSSTAVQFFIDWWTMQILGLTR